ncbi:MAG: tetratricopeptide repeat protein [Candidatus Omnitrophota bacterium]
MLKKILFFIPIIIISILLIIQLNRQLCIAMIFKFNSIPNQIQYLGEEEQEPSAPVEYALEFLKIRKDEQALAAAEKILAQETDNLEALWVKAEFLRRKGFTTQARDLLYQILNINPQHFSSLNSLAYIKYKNNDLNSSLSLVNKILNSPGVDNNNLGMAYLMLATINSALAQDGNLVDKLFYSGKIKRYFLKAKELAPDLPEVYLGLGSFYLMAPSIIGGNYDKAIEELEQAVKLAPDFATVNIRLAQAYKMKGDNDKYRVYISRSKALDPNNEILKELGE